MSEEEVKKYNARVIPKGNVTMSCVGRFGLSAVVEEDIVTNQQIYGFVVPEELDPKYLAYLIKAQQEYLEAKATSTTIKYLNKTNCESLPIPLPPLAEQKRIVAKVESLLGLCDSLRSQLVQGEAERSRLLASLLAGIARG